jgi:hypothetical protein
MEGLTGSFDHHCPAWRKSLVPDSASQEEMESQNSKDEFYRTCITFAPRGDLKSLKLNHHMLGLCVLNSHRFITKDQPQDKVPPVRLVRLSIQNFHGASFLGMTLNTPDPISPALPLPVLQPPTSLSDGSLNTK